MCNFEICIVTILTSRQIGIGNSFEFVFALLEKLIPAGVLTNVPCRKLCHFKSLFHKKARLIEKQFSMNLSRIS